MVLAFVRVVVHIHVYTVLIYYEWQYKTTHLSVYFSILLPY